MRSQAQHRIKYIKIIIGGRYTLRSRLCVAIWHTLLLPVEPTAMFPPRGEEKPGHMWHMKRAVCGTLFQEPMKQVFGEAGCNSSRSAAARKTNSMAANQKRRYLSRLKCLDSVELFVGVGSGAEEHGQPLKRPILYVKGQGFEWLEDPKHIAAIIQNCSKVGAKPQSSPGRNDIGCDSEALDEVPDQEAKLCHPYTGWTL